MGKGITAIALATPLPDWASISGIYSVQKWLHDEAVPSYGYSVPAQYPEIKKLVRFLSFVGHVSDCRRNEHAPEQRSELLQSRPESPHCISEKDQSYTDVLRITETHGKY
jgi:hypothetical protein